MSADWDDDDDGPDYEGDRREAARWARFMSRVQKTETCWLWTGGRDHGGYGSARWGTTVLKAHRVAYGHLVGPIPAGLVLDHLCRIRHCVNPAHLEAVTLEENNRRGNAVRDYSKRNYRNANMLKTHCIHGHPLAGNNLYVYGENGRRRCKTCATGRQRIYRAAKGA